MHLYHLLFRFIHTKAFKEFGNVERKIKSVFGFPSIVMIGRNKIYLGNIYPACSSFIHDDSPSIMVAEFMKMKISRAPNKNINDLRMDERIYSLLKSNN